jgi:hypothetical protein
VLFTLKPFLKINRLEETTATATLRGGAPINHLQFQEKFLQRMVLKKKTFLRF